MLVALVVPPAVPPPGDPAAPCSHPRRVPVGTLAAPRRTFCVDCQSFLEE